jgi:hypothetical protein
MYMDKEGNTLAFSKEVCFEIIEEGLLGLSRGRLAVQFFPFLLTLQFHLYRQFPRYQPFLPFP